MNPFVKLNGSKCRRFAFRRIIKVCLAAYNNNNPYHYRMESKQFALYGDGLS